MQLVDRVAVIPHYDPSVSLTPDDLKAAITAPLERWRVRSGDQLISFDAFVLQSILGHPVLVMAKGERAVDSRMPRTLRARVEPRLVREGARVHGIVAVVNEGDTLWLGGGADTGRVQLGVQLLSPERKLLLLDFARSVLPRDIPPSARIEVGVDARLPDASTRYVLKLDMVDEHVCWFEDAGSRPVYVSV